MTLSFTAAPLQPIFLRGDTVHLKLALSNPGDREVELPEPLEDGSCGYTLTTPSGRELWDAKAMPLYPSDPAPRPGPEEGDDVEPPPPPMRLKPGEQWTGLVELNELFKLAEPGTYQITARIRWKDLELEAPRQEFTLEELQILQISRGGSSAPSTGAASLLLLRPKNDGRALLFSPVTLAEGKADIKGGPLRIGGPSELVTVSKEAVDPVETSAVSVVDGYWNFWREGNTLLGTRGAADTPRSLPLPGTVEQLIEPALLDGGSVTHVYAVSAKGNARSLVVARFMDYLENPVNPERVLAEVPLEGPPSGCAAYIDKVQYKPRRILALGRIEGRSPRIDWISYAGDSVPASFHSHEWKVPAGAEPVADSRPAIHGLREGGHRIAWIVLEAGKPTKALVCEATFDASGAPRSESTLVLTTESPIQAARVAYPEDVPVVALWTEDGKVLSGTEGRLRVIVPKSLRRVPPTMLVLRGRAFVLEFDAVKALTLAVAR